MSDVFYLRPIDPPITPADVQEMARHADGCFGLHRVDWVRSFLAADGARMLCWYRAPDAESARLALRQLGSDMNAVWTGQVMGSHGTGAATLSDVNVLAEFSFDARPGEDEVAASEAALDAALGEHGVARVGGFVSTSGTRRVYLFQAAGEDAVRAALNAANAGATGVWACRALTPSLQVDRESG